jgi:hypothetical protein
VSKQQSQVKEGLLADLLQLRQQPGWERFQVQVQNWLARALVMERAGNTMEDIRYARGQSDALDRIAKWFDHTYQEVLTTPAHEFGGTENGG